MIIPAMIVSFILAQKKNSRKRVLLVIHIFKFISVFSFLAIHIYYTTVNEVSCFRCQWLYEKNQIKEAIRQRLSGQIIAPCTIEVIIYKQVNMLLKNYVSFSRINITFYSLDFEKLNFVIWDNLWFILMSLTGGKVVQSSRLEIFAFECHQC